MQNDPDIGLPSADFLAELFAGAGLSVPAEAAEKLLAHAGELLRWNRSIRLTAITAPEEIAVKHILDSLLLLAFSPFPGRILDFGSGAGYPGIPLAITLPGSQVVLLESSRKKCAFLSHLRRVLPLPNAEVVAGRLSAGHPLPIGRFDHIVTRATLPEGEAVPLLFPYLAPGGRILLMRGPGKKGKRERADGGGPAWRGPPAARSLRFELPMRMGSREIREIRNP